MQARFVHWRSPLAATLILVLLVTVTSFIVTRKINDAEHKFYAPC